MCPVKKSGAASELNVSPHLADPILQRRLSEQNLWALLTNLPGEYTKQDIFDYLKSQHSQLTDLVQNYLTMSTGADVKAPHFTVTTSEMDQNSAFNSDEQKGLAALMNRMLQLSSKSAKGDMSKSASAPPGQGSSKFAVAPKSSSAKADNEAPQQPFDGPSVTGEASAYLQELDNFLLEYDNKIFEAQLAQQLESKNEELKAEMQRIVDKVRRGDLDAVWILVAVAKVNSSRNGLLFSQFGKKLWRMNDESNRVMNELLPGLDSNIGNVQILQQKQKEIGFQQQFLIQDMQKLTQNIEQTLNFAKTTIDEIFKTRLHIINAPFKSL